jgi:ethanolamine utilization protein EutQ (cupin superfamily)
VIVVKDSEKKKHNPSESVCVYEYDTADTDLGGAVATIKGRYPKLGFVVNLKVKQLAYVLSGKGEIITPEGIRILAAGDIVFISANEKFAWNGTMNLFLANAPRFDPEQYKETN